MSDLAGFIRRVVYVVKFSSFLEASQAQLHVAYEARVYEVVSRPTVYETFDVDRVVMCFYRRWYLH